MAEKGRRGFAAMDREKQRQIASLGGKAAHRKGTAHEFTPEEAREAGRKGGQAAHERGTAHVFTPEEAREAGRKGGQSSHARRATRSTEEPPLPETEAFKDGQVAEDLEFHPETKHASNGEQNGHEGLPVHSDPVA